MTKRGQVSKEAIEEVEKGYELAEGEVWLEKPPEVTLYKFLARDGSSPFRGDKGWSLPQFVNGEWVPGEWREDPQKLITCTYGLHLFPAKHTLEWCHDNGGRLFVAEVEGGLIDATRWNRKFVARKVRLVREILDWKGIRMGRPDPDVGDDILPYLAKYRDLLPADLKPYIGDTMDATRDAIRDARGKLEAQIELNGAKLQVRRWQNKVRKLTGKEPLKPSSLQTRTRRLEHRQQLLGYVGYFRPIHLMACIDTGARLKVDRVSRYVQFVISEKNRTRYEERFQEIKAKYEPPERTDYGDIPAEIIETVNGSAQGYRLN